MQSIVKNLLALLIFVACATPAHAQITQKVVDIPTRTGVSQRMLVVAPQQPRAAVILFAGGDGGLQIKENGALTWGEEDFLIRTRWQFALAGLFAVLVDAPSDRQRPPFLAGFRQQPEHAEDIKAVIKWAGEQARVPVWLIGTSQGTQSAASIATELRGPKGPDGLVLASTILIDNQGRPVPEMPLGKLRIPVLVVHHEQDGCKLCPFGDIPGLMKKFSNSPKKQLLTFKGGKNLGDPCEVFTYHGFNGIEHEVVNQIASWIIAK
jgi:pimeloyl-ACP methyl ester carboxylesterase